MRITSCGLRVVVVACLVALISAPALAADFSIVLMPDTQYYSTENEDFPKCSFLDGVIPKYVPGIYQRQAQWIVDNAWSYNIQRVIHLGDITDGAESAHWNVATQAHDILAAAGIPFSVLPGNHDYDGNTLRGRNLTTYNSNFGLGSSYPTWYDGQYDGSEGGSGIDNTFVEFQQEGMDFLLVNLEYRPRKSAICWANEVISSHPGHRVIVATHGYQTHGGVHASTSTEVIGRNGWNLWDELIRRHSNIFLVLSGHVNDSEHITRTGLAGNVIHEVLTDYQYESPQGKEEFSSSDGKGRCGNGWLKLLRFYPSANRIDVVTKSSERTNLAVFSSAPSTEFFTDDYHRDPATDEHVLSLPYDMTSGLSPYVFSEGTSHFGDMVVNSTDDGNQRDPQIAMDTAGNMVVVWEDDRSGNGYYDIFMRGFTPGGCELFSERRVSDYGPGQQLKPAVAMNDAGDIVVVWEDDTDGNGAYDIRTRGFDAQGNPRWSGFEVNATTSGQHRDPFVAMAPDGSFIVVYEDDSDGNGYFDVRMRGFDVNGAVRIIDQKAHTNDSGQQNDGFVAVDDDGNFVVTWRHDPDKNDSYDIWIHGFNSNGTARFSDRRVNSDSSGQQNDPFIAMEPDGDFIVVWEDDKDGNGSFDIRASRYLATGAKDFETGVNTLTSGEQRNPGVSVNSNGDWVVVWQDDSDGNGSYDIRARGFGNGSISEWFSDMVVNTEVSGQQQLPEVFVDDSGCFVTVWKDDLDNNDLWEVAARGIAFYDVETASTGGGSVSSRRIQVPSGEWVDLTASPATSYDFVGWVGDAENPRALSTRVFVDSDKVVTAQFEPIENSIADGLVAYWSFDEDFSATVGGTEFDGTASGSSKPVVLQGAGRFGACADFNGTNGSCVVVDSPVIAVGEDHSYSAWHRASWTTIGNFNDRYFVLETEGVGEAYSASYGLRDIEGDGLDTQGEVYTQWSFDNAHTSFDQSTGEEQWHNVVVTYDASKGLHSVYFDGVLKKTMESWSALEPTTGLVIGAHRDKGRNWDGQIDDVAFWNRTLTTEEIASIQTSSILQTVTAVDPTVGETVLNYSLSRAWPNPFGSQTTVQLALPVQGPVHVGVYDARGRRVKTLIQGVLPVGNHKVHWSGKDDAGQSVANGVYFVNMQAGDFQKTEKVAIVR